MQTRYTVAKYKGQAAGPTHVELVRLSGLTWDATAFWVAIDTATVA